MIPIAGQQEKEIVQVPKIMTWPRLEQQVEDELCHCRVSEVVGIPMPGAPKRKCTVPDPEKHPFPFRVYWAISNTTQCEKPVFGGPLSKSEGFMRTTCSSYQSPDFGLEEMSKVVLRLPRLDLEKRVRI